MGKEETRDAEIRSSDGKIAYTYRRGKPQPPQFCLICFSALIQPAELSSVEPLDDLEETPSLFMWTTHLLF